MLYSEEFTEGGQPSHTCVPTNQCDDATPYRTYTGWCNNQHYHKYGNAFNAYRRLLPPVYQDGAFTYLL